MLTVRASSMHDCLADGVAYDARPPSSKMSPAIVCRILTPLKLACELLCLGPLVLRLMYQETDCVAYVRLQEHAVISAALGLKPGEGVGGLGRTFTPEVSILQELQLVEERIAGCLCI